jgi:hypothetical protein
LEKLFLIVLHIKIPLHESLAPSCCILSPLALVYSVEAPIVLSRFLNESTLIDSARSFNRK